MQCRGRQMNKFVRYPKHLPIAISCILLYQMAIFWEDLRYTSETCLIRCGFYEKWSVKCKAVFVRSSCKILTYMKRSKSGFGYQISSPWRLISIDQRRRLPDFSNIHIGSTRYARSLSTRTHRPCLCAHGRRREGGTLDRQENGGGEFEWLFDRVPFSLADELLSCLLVWVDSTSVVHDGPYCVVVLRNFTGDRKECYLSLSGKTT